MRFERKRPELAVLRAEAATRPLLPSQIALAAGLAGLALILRLHGLAAKSFWFDELVTWGRARLPLAQLAVDSFKHKQLPTYFLLVSPFATPVDAEWMLRFPSAGFGAACVFLVAGVASEVRGLIAGLAAGLLMALSPTEVQFSQEARPYVLGSALVLAALWGLVRLASRPEAAALPIARAGALPGAWTAYTLGTLGALCVENNTFPWLLASNLALALLVQAVPAARRNWACSQAVILGIWLPALAVTLAMNRGSELDALLWVEKPTWEALRSTVAAVYLFRVSDLMTFRLMPTPVPGFGGIIALLACFGAWRLRRERPQLVVIGLALVALPLTILIVSFVQPLVVPRYLLWSTGPFFALAAIGAASLPARISAPALLLLAAGGAVSLAPYYRAETKPQWREAAAYLAQHVRPQDALVAENMSVRYVLTAYGLLFPPLPSSGPILSFTPNETLRQVAAAARIWVIYGRVGQGVQEPQAQFLHRWASFGPPAQEIKFGASVLVLRFDRPPQQDAEGGPEGAPARGPGGGLILSGDAGQGP